MFPQWLLGAEAVAKPTNRTGDELAYRFIEGYEKATTLVTFNRPFSDWSLLISGDVVAQLQPAD